MIVAQALICKLNPNSTKPRPNLFSLKQTNKAHFV